VNIINPNSGDFSRLGRSNASICDYTLHTGLSISEWQATKIANSMRRILPFDVYGTRERKPSNRRIEQIPD
jgi:hypothetical protein